MRNHSVREIPQSIVGSSEPRLIDIEDYVVTVEETGLYLPEANSTKHF